MQNIMIVEMQSYSDSYHFQIKNRAMFSWINKDTDRLKHKDVYDSVTSGLQTTYRDESQHLFVFDHFP